MLCGRNTTAIHQAENPSGRQIPRDDLEVIHLISAETRPAECPRTYPVAFFALALTLAHRFFIAFEILALPAADRTCCLTPVISLFAE
jgi:hypothetical protein